MRKSSIFRRMHDILWFWTFQVEHDW